MAARTLDLLVTGATIVTPRWTGEFTVGALDGRIAYLGDETGAPAARTTVHARGLHLLPGLVDAHVHMRDPGFPHEEDFRSGTVAAAFGGMATVIDMPNTNPPPVDGQSFTAKVRNGQPQAAVDFAMTGLLTEASTAADMAAMLDAGAIGLNVFNGVDLFGHAPPGTGTLWELLRSAPRNVLIGQLCESQELIRAALIEGGRRDLRNWQESRTEVAETAAIAGHLALAAATGARVHVNHLSSGKGLGLIARQRSAGTRVTCETSPHQLFFTRERLARETPLAPVTPPLREQADCDALWAGLNSGAVDILVSDHAPHAENALTRENLWDPQVTGFTGAETTVPVMATAAYDGRLSLQRLAWLMAESPARLFGLYPRKGALQVGSDADLTLLDMGQVRPVVPSELHSRGKLTPFAGWRLRGWPRHTIVGGELVMTDGELVSSAAGRFVKRTTSI